jgi:hypothetical protein
MIQLANAVDQDLMALYKQVNNWVGTPGQVVDSFKDFALAPQRLDDCVAPDCAPRSCERGSIRAQSRNVIPVLDGVNDISNYRLDVLFGVRALDGRLATRLPVLPDFLTGRFQPLAWSGLRHAGVFTACQFAEIVLCVPCSLFWRVAKVEP